MNIHAHGEILRRRDEILRIIGGQNVHSQDELLAILRRRGVRVTQPTLSRDLRELGVAKSPKGYVAPGIAAFAPPELREERFEQLVRDNVLSAEAGMNMVVIKTPPAAAQPVASAMDAAALDDVLGTVGGDDTVFVCLRTPSAATAFARHLQQIAGISTVPERGRRQAR
jgi:transcriptional regulator of arginine metabolism